MTLNDYEIFSKLFLNCVQVLFYALVLPWTLYSGYKLLKDKMDESRYRTNQFRKTLMDEWFDKFLTEDAMNERNAITKFWAKNYWEWDVGACIRRSGDLDITAICDAAAKGSDLHSAPTGHKIKFVKSAAEIDVQMMNKTSELLNQYEHLGILVEAGIISKKDVGIFFYTSISDTFIACLPFIVYRRTVDKKLAYAHKFELLSADFPQLSESWCRV